MKPVLDLLKEVEVAGIAHITVQIFRFLTSNKLGQLQWKA